MRKKSKGEETEQAWGDRGMRDEPRKPKEKGKTAGQGKRQGQEERKVIIAKVQDGRGCAQKEERGGERGRGEDRGAGQRTGATDGKQSNQNAATRPNAEAAKGRPTRGTSRGHRGREEEEGKDQGKAKRRAKRKGQEGAKK
ncbi:PREDICTED: transcription elongation factor A protein-like 5 [Ipomoea nil]|uniref:transcription elongation factor A protein-like 5 n=1 Tax=Ipomoea nil TaxID=35883 RepID=UPI000901EE91|nr:PREDICTED: transcription elongation factor A protein-like 5 [Ipomoea nil]